MPVSAWGVGASLKATHKHTYIRPMCAREWDCESQRCNNFVVGRRNPWTVSNARTIADKGKILRCIILVLHYMIVQLHFTFSLCKQNCLSYSSRKNWIYHSLSFTRFNYLLMRLSIAHSGHLIFTYKRSTSFGIIMPFCGYVYIYIERERERESVIIVGQENYSRRSRRSWIKDI